MVLSRKKNESIVIDVSQIEIPEDGLIEITVVDIRGDKVRLGCDAPRSVPVHRREVYDAINRELNSSATLVLEASEEQEDKKTG